MSDTRLTGMIEALGQRLERLEHEALPTRRDMDELHWFLRDLGFAARTIGYRALGSLCLDVAERAADHRTVGRAFMLWIHAWQHHAANYLRSPNSLSAAAALLRIMGHAPNQRALRTTEAASLLKSLRTTPEHLFPNQLRSVRV